MSKKEFLPVNENGEFDEQRWLQLAKMAEMGLSVASIVHEVRQPLSAIKMAVQIANGEKDERERGDCLDEALKQTKRVEQLIERIRNFLRPGTQERTQEDLCTLLSGVISLVTGDLKNRSEVVVFRAGEDLPELLIDKNKIEQLFFNLIGNARDAIFEKVDGRIVLIIRKSGQDHVEAVVADNGSGIDPERVAKVFDPYFTTKGEVRGTGLGLFIAKRIAQQHNAEIELLDKESLDDLGEGELSTAFKVTFSLKESEATVPPPKKTGVQNGNRVLIVDDEEVIRKLIKKAFAKENLQCSLAASGEEAVALLEQREFDLLVVDKNLPGISGIEVARLARNLNPRIPILVMTGFPSEESAIEAASLKVFDYLLKPIDVDELRVRVRDIFRMSEHFLPPPPPPPSSSSSSSSTRTEQPEPITTIPPPKSGNSQAGLYSSYANLSTERPSTARHSMNGLTVVLVENDKVARQKLTTTIGRLGCKVTGFSDADQADKYIDEYECDVVIARPEVIRTYRDWFVAREGRSHSIGAIAVMERGGVDKAIEAIHIGAQGTIVSPFNEDKVAFDFKRAVARLLEG